MSLMADGKNAVATKDAAAGNNSVTIKDAAYKNTAN